MTDNATSDAREDRKAVRFKRMRRTATCLLGAMIALLFACVVYQAEYPWLTWLRAFAEAGTVGAIADWYAVVALFRHPFGMPIPHTAIIAQNQQRIAESLGNFVEENFLTPELVTGRLRDHNASRALAEWLAEPANSRAIADVVADSLPGLLNGIDDADVARFFDRSVMLLRTLDVSRIAGNILKVVTEGDRHQPLLDRGLQALEQWLTLNVDLIKAKFSTASRYTPARLDAYIVDKFVEGIVALLHEVVANEQHELRRQFDEAMQDLIVQLQTSAVHRRFGKGLMRDCVRHLRNGDYPRVLLDQVRTRVTADVNRENSLVRAVAASLLASLGKGLRRERAMQHKLNAWWLDLAHTLVVRYRRQIPALITEVVKSWNAEEVSRKIEAEIGRDLQYIRINGTFVGGVVGVLIHATALFATR
ncbi:DUF445 domain-containing protein [Caballeronia sp. SEWSISQ10-4 2]|uniref:DUF445 domain-containing protein n=1 Tax=Caballeronia sp. SEWSISQ10-4 2 TaxID=2937438 RepID=UPI002650C168|nr:DUF445 domain-containing protein [Caballeronia sp. SEWSISQ10-4 2]MDN7177373.1 DUF445 domain-containing protein [Caballeronia sp. SEWSISQ10-4 2]